MLTDEVAYLITQSLWHKLHLFAKIIKFGNAVFR